MLWLQRSGGTSPAGPSSVPVAAAGAEGSIEALPGHIHDNNKCDPAPKCHSFLGHPVSAGAMGGFLGQEHVTSPAEVVCAVGQLAGEWLLLPWPCPALAVTSVPLEKAIPLWVLSQRCCCLCSPARSWCHFMFPHKLSRIFTVSSQTPVCHLV